MTLKLLSTSFTLWYIINISTLSWTYFSDQCQTTALIHVVKPVDEREFLIITQLKHKVLFFRKQIKLFYYVIHICFESCPRI
jgi:hypothetical protein